MQDDSRDGSTSTTVTCDSEFAADLRHHRTGRCHPAFVGRRVGRYLLQELLGAGGMGEVYLAEHQLLRRPCAVKLIRSDRATDPAAIARFEREVQLTARLTHPNTVEIYDFGVTDDGTLYCAMEYLPGLDLQQIVDRTGPMPPGRVIHLLRQVCGALGEAHRLGIVHRDIKPGNILAAERGGVRDVAKLLDFGLVKAMSPVSGHMAASREGMVVGSPLYAAPELMLGDREADPRTDIYSLGATACFLLTGRPVFPGENALQIVLAHLQQSPVPPSQLCREISPELEALLLRCLARSPENRFATVADLDTALMNCTFQHTWTEGHITEWWRKNGDACPGPSCRTADQLAETSLLPLVAV